MTLEVIPLVTVFMLELAGNATKILTSPKWPGEIGYYRLSPVMQVRSKGLTQDKIAAGAGPRGNKSAAVGPSLWDIFTQGLLTRLPPSSSDLSFR